MKVVVIDDAPEILEIVSLCFELRWPRTIILSAAEGGEGLKLIEMESPDLVLLNLGLADMSGFDILRQIRQFSNVPIIVLAVREGEVDIVRAFEMGADDYIIKPFGYIQLLARSQAVLRRAQMLLNTGGGRSFTSDNLSVDFTTRQVRLGGELVKLTPVEYDVLYQLVKNAGQVLTRETLLEKVWGSEYIVEKDYVDVCIKQLRKKLKQTRRRQLIMTVPGAGYKFVALAKTGTPTHSKGK